MNELADKIHSIEALKTALPTALHLHRAILRTGTSLIEKRQIRHLKAFRMAVVKEGPDVSLFTHPAALTKLALWVGEAIAEQEREQRGGLGKNGSTPLVLAGLNDARGVYVVVGTGGGGGVVDFAARAKRKLRIEEKLKAKEAKAVEREEKRRAREEKRAAEGVEEGVEDEETEDEEDESDDSDDDDDLDGQIPIGKNRFGLAFQKVIAETNARVRVDSFENCVVEVKKEDLSGFLEALSVKAVVG